MSGAWFPTLLFISGPRQGLFSTYVALWTSSHLLVYSSRLANAPSYNATSVVLLTETVKLFLAGAMYVAPGSKDGSMIVCLLPLPSETPHPERRLGLKCGLLAELKPCLPEAYDGSFQEMLRISSQEVRVLLRYAIPALQLGGSWTTFFFAAFSHPHHFGGRFGSFSARLIFGGGLQSSTGTDPPQNSSRTNAKAFYKGPGIELFKS